MTPTPDEPSSASQELLERGQVESTKAEKNKIVISGMSGLYPQARNLKDLSHILYNKIDPISESNLRWNFKHPESTKYVGLAPDLDRFDAQFFSVYQRLGNYIDPISRKILEQTFQAIYDAGLSPAHLYGKKVAVFVGSSYTDSELTGMVDKDSKRGLGLLGCSKTMFANRVSYWLNVRGPSVSFDDADCSSTMALEAACSVLKLGDCEAAIVGGGFLNLLPHSSVYHKRMSAVLADGKTRSFDDKSNGYILSDGLGVLFLQKAEDALRIYAEVKHVKNKFISLANNDNGPHYGYFRNSQITANFMKMFYEEAQVSPQAVEYVEAYGTGISDADKAELDAIAEVYCKDRTEALPVGSITSNIGLTEAASGIAAITKVLLGYHTGKLAANLHFSEPRQDIEAVRKGHIRVVTEHEPVDHSYIALNGMSFSGINSHVLLHGHYKPKDLSVYKSTLPHLVTISGRQESAVQKIFDDLKKRSIDPEELALLHNIHSTNISGHLGRGYVILGTDDNQNTVSLYEKVEYFDNASRPLWFVYSGMGSQWATMGAQLMRIPIFVAAIERCHQVLTPKGLNLVDIITSPDKTIFDNILHSFVGIAAIQIGLTDLLRELGLVPDGIIGHSVGELGCAYADGCLTAEEMILAAYSRGLVSLETELIDGSMAAVGLGYKQISDMCPPEIDVACHNGPDSSTISGPADVMREFVAQLTAKGIFAKEVPCSNIAYHSRYIADAGPNLLKYLKDVIRQPKLRSPRWLSTSVPKEKWDDESAKYCSAEYQTNNLLSSVLFEETAKMIPSNAVVVEVAPHGLLQAILKRSLSADCRHVPLTKRGHPDNALFLLQAIGNLYMEGYKPKVQVLYPKIQFPVSTSTPMLSHLPEWVHIENWNVFKAFDEYTTSAAACKFLISLHDEEQCYLQGNVIREKTCFPFSAALIFVWDTLAMSLGKPKKSISVQFTDLHLYAQPHLLNQKPFKVHVTMHRGTGYFEVSSEYSRIVSGHINQFKEATKYIGKICHGTDDLMLNDQEIYQLLRDKDYAYSGDFRSIECASASLDEATLVWNNNWVTLIDGMLQLNVLQQKYNSISLPEQIRRVCIDVKQHVNGHQFVKNNKNVMTAHVDNILGFTRCGGVIIEDIQFRNVPRLPRDHKSVELVIPQDITNVNPIVSETSGVTLQSSKFGSLDSLQWVNAPQHDHSDLTVKVHYTALNVFDVKKATGVTFNGHNAYGMEYSGITKSGNRVMGIVENGAASTEIRARPDLLWPVPAHWSLEDAATVPLAYAIAFYCFVAKGYLGRGMRILVHGGAGAVGQAVIAVALAYDCQVFTTVSSIHKKRFLQKLFPELKGEHIGNSRDGSFEDTVKAATKGKGCNIVINCAQGDLKNASFRCCGILGILIDLVQVEKRENFIYGMGYMSQMNSYLTVDVSTFLADTEFTKDLHRMMSDGIALGYVRPLSRVTYAPQNVARAFRLLATNQHRGRVLLQMQDKQLQAQHSITCSSDLCHLLMWYDDVLGVQLTEMLISRGVNKICIHLIAPTTYHYYKIENWKKRGIEVVISSDDLTQSYGATTLINKALTMGPIEGIYMIHTANTMLPITDLTRVVRNVDSASRILCPQLRYHLIASTATSLGQDTCLSRASSGFAATSLDLSSIANGEEYDHHFVTEAIERALSSTHVTLSARIKEEKTPSLLEKLAALADISIPEDVKPDDTLEKFGLTDVKIQVITAFLNDMYNISLDEEKIPALTPQKIQRLATSMEEPVKPKVRGLDMFFSNVSADVLRATSDLVMLPTLFKDSRLLQNEFDVNHKYLCMVPGMEGHFEQFKAMCKRLKVPALILQPGYDHPHETISETALRLAKTLLNNGMAQDNFYLLGNESGVLIALELAAILEENGLTGTVYCVGCPPEELQVEIEEQLSDLVTEEQLQNAVVQHMTKLITSKDIEGLDTVLKSAATWTDKIEACERYVRSRTPHVTQYVRALITSALARIEQVRRYKFTGRPLRSQLVLLRAATEIPPPLETTLQKYSQRPVIMHQLHSSLSNITSDSAFPSIVNKYFDVETQKAYEEQNQCDTYISRNKSW